jgi:long-chain acyl-CoA synthetase
VLDRDRLGDRALMREVGARSVGLASPSLTLDPGMDTFPKLAQGNARRMPDKVAIREKGYGIWQAYSWARYVEATREVALGLAALGFARGDRTAIVGDNRPELYWAMLATQALGGIPVPLYQDSIEAEMQYIVDHAEARFAVVEDQEQVDKLLRIKADCPHLQHVIYKDARGMRHYQDPSLVSLDAVRELGRAFGREHPGAFEEEIARGKADDVAVICYTSGTTGRPKGAMLTHRNLILTARNAVAREKLSSADEVVAYLPMAWIGDHMFSFGQSIVAGFTTNCPESADTVLHDLREIGPTYFFAPPRIWEGILTRVMVRIDDAAAPKRWLIRFFLDLARRVERRRMARERIALGDRALYQLGRVLVYGPLRDNLGMRRIRVAYTAGEAIGPELFEFYRAIGINVKQLYGMTESSALVCIQEDGDVKLDTVGTPLPGVELRISEAGEVLYRSPGVFAGYYKNPEATRATLEDGWIRSGDAGVVDADGHLKIIDRARDVGRLADGTLFAPKYLENKLKFSPYVMEAVAFGGEDRPFVTAMMSIDADNVATWAERNHLSFTTYTDLAQKPQVYELIAEHVARANQDLPPGARIKRFVLLHKQLDADDEELTRTRKVRRGVINQRYADIIAALYGDGRDVTIRTTVTYQDGTKVERDVTLAIKAVTNGSAPAEPAKRERLVAGSR